MGMQRMRNRGTLKPSSESNEDRTPRSEKGKMRLWTKRVKYELVDYNSLPSHMKDNEYILGHYRTEWPLKQIFLSVFTIHNETFNVWTHLIGFFLFLSLTIYTVANILGPVMGRPISRWPMFAFLGGAMFCLLASSACHLLYCHSERLSYILLRLDYAGISALISTSFYPPVYYSFMCQPYICTIYMGFITLLGLGAVVGSLHPVFQIPKYRKFRASLFFGMGVSGAVPILHKLFVFGQHHPEAVQTTVYEAVMGLLYGVGALVYAMRIPERWMPGRFDIVGHSHQIFHVLVVAGAYVHYRAGLLYLSWRDTAVSC